MTPEHLGSLQNILAFLRENGFARSEASLVEEVRSLLEKAELEKAALDEAASDPARSRSRSPPRRTAAPPPSDDSQLPLSPPHVPPPPARLARFGSDVEQLASDLAANAERPDDALAGRARAPPSVVSAATDDFASALEEPTADPPESPRADPGPRKSLAAAVDRLAIDDDRPSDDDEHLSDDDEDDREDVRSASASASPSASASSRSPRSTASGPSRAWHDGRHGYRLEVLTGGAAAAFLAARAPRSSAAAAAAAAASSASAASPESAPPKTLAPPGTKIFSAFEATAAAHDAASACETETASGGGFNESGGFAFDPSPGGSGTPVASGEHPPLGWGGSEFGGSPRTPFSDGGGGKGDASPRGDLDSAAEALRAWVGEKAREEEGAAFSNKEAFSREEDPPGATGRVEEEAGEDPEAAAKKSSRRDEDGASDGGLSMNSSGGRSTNSSVGRSTNTSACRSTPPDELETLTLRVVRRKRRTGFEPDARFRASPGTLVAGRYVFGNLLGSAAFGDAYGVVDVQTGRRLCAKVVKNVGGNKDAFDQALDEIAVLSFLNRADPRDERGILRAHDYFYHREHLFIVTERLRANLYECLRRDADRRAAGVGAPFFTLARVRRVARQLFASLAFAHRLGVIHCDVKPENVMLAGPASRCAVKLIDLGSSCFAESDRLGHYVQSRTYRAPEVVLGAGYDAKIDVWSAACVLAELVTGEVLFASDSEATLVASAVAALGPFPETLMRRGKRTKEFFADGRSSSPGGARRSSGGVREGGPVVYEVLVEEDGGSDAGTPGRSSKNGGGGAAEKSGGKSVSPRARRGRGPAVRVIAPDPRATLEARLAPGLADEDPKDAASFAAFLRAALEPDPDDRVRVADALEHPWLAKEDPEALFQGEDEGLRGFWDEEDDDGWDPRGPGSNDPATRL